MRDESEKEIVHRLEAFSDIVIGFSLAQLGLSLAIPKHAMDVFSVHSGIIIALAVTFGLVCAVWWTHHRLFRYTFVPTPVSIFANFAALGGVIFLAYSMQILVKAGLGDPVAYAMYSGSYAWIMLLFAVMAWIGIRARGAKLTGADRANGVRFAVRISIVGVWLALLTAVALTVGPRSPLNTLMVVLIVASLAAHRIILRRRTPAIPET
jgi:uncharacterized membrane protein